MKINAKVKNKKNTNKRYISKIRHQTSKNVTVLCYHELCASVFAVIMIDSDSDREIATEKEKSDSDVEQG